MPEVTRPELRWQVDWTDSNTYGQTDGYPPADLAPYIQSAYIESGGGSYRRSSAETARVSGRVAGRIRCTNTGGQFSTRDVTTYDTALARPHVGRLTSGSATRPVVQEYRIELVHADDSEAEFLLTSKFPMLNTRLGDELTTSGNVTPVAYAKAILTLAAAVDSNLTKPTVRGTVPAALRVGAAGSTLEVPDTSVSDLLDELGLGCLGWWSEDFDGVPHLWSLTSVGSATRYATVDESWRPLASSSRISRPIGMLRNVMPGQAQTTTRTQAITLRFSRQEIINIRDNIGTARGNRTLTYTLPTPMAGGTYTLNSVSFSAVLPRLTFFVIGTSQGAQFTSQSVTSYFSVLSSAIVNNVITVVVRNNFGTYNDTWTAVGRLRGRDTDYTLSLSSLVGGDEGSVRVSHTVSGLTLTATATYTVTNVTEAEDGISVQRYGRRKLPAQTEHVPMFGQLTVGRATLPILAGPPVLADLTIPLWATNVTPQPITLRIGDRIRIRLQGQTFEAAVLSLRWQVSQGQMPSVRVLALQATSGVTVTVPAPNPPPGVSVTAGDGQLTVAWSDPTSGTTPDGYQLQWKLVTAGTYQTHSLTGTSYVITGLTNGSGYDIRVRSTHTTAGSSAWVVSTGTPQAAIPAPSAVQSLAGQRGDGQVTLTWEAPTVGSPTQYRVRYRPVGSSAAHTTGTHSGSPVTISGLTNGTEYQFDVRAEDQTNNLFGPWTSVRVTPSSTQPLPAPGVPTGLTVTPVDSFTLAVAWTAPTSGGAVTAYTVRWRRTGAIAWSSRSGFSGASGQLGSLTAGAEYEVQVRADGQDRSSAYTASVTASTLPPAPGVPANLSGVADDGQVVLSWQRSSLGGVPVSYTVNWRTGSEAWSSQTVTGLTLTVTGLTNGTAYQFRVAATNTGGTSAWSTVVTVTPSLPAAPAVPAGVTVLPGDSLLVVTWQAAARATSYEIRLNTAGAWTTVATGITALTYTVTSLTNGTAYGIAVRARNSGGVSAWSTTLTRTPQQSQPAPTLSVLGSAGANVQIRIAYSTPAGWRIVPRNDGQYQIQKDDGDGTWDSFFLNAITAGQQPLWGQLQGAYWVNNVSWADSVSGQRRFRIRMHIRPRGAGQEANALYTEWATADVPRPASQSEDSPQLIWVTCDGYLVTADTYPTATLEVLNAGTR